MTQQEITIDTKEELENNNYELVTSKNPELSLTQDEGPEYNDNGKIEYAMVQNQATEEIKEIYLQEDNDSQATYRIGTFGKDVLDKGEREIVEENTAQTLKDLTDQIL